MTPKISVFSPDSSGRIDPSISLGILQHIPLVSLHDSDVVIVPVAYMSDFVFNPQITPIVKPVILFDFLEFSWSAGDKENRLGLGALRQFGHLSSDEWTKFDEWVRDHTPILTFKRELMLEHRTPTCLPVEWPCVQPALPLQSKAEFDARPMEVFSCWGLSHPLRPRLHGDVFRNAHDYNINILDDFRDDGHFEDRRNWASIHVPHWRRTHINEVMRWNRRAKLSVSLPGAGAKCFRHTMESPVGSIMALPKDSLAWSYDWVDGFNCVRLHPEHLFDSLECATHWDSLYSIYVESQKTVEKYRAPAYARDYISKSIESIL